MSRNPSRIARTAATIAGLSVIAGVGGVGLASASAQGTTHFLALGDWGAGGSDQAAVAKAMCTSNTARPAAFVLTVGDNFYSPDGVANGGDYYTPEACLLSQGVTWRAAWGNHDLGGDSTATVLGARAKYYSFVDGSTRFIMLNGNDPTGRTQRAWLERTLKNAKEPVRIVVEHQPPYTAGLHSPSYEAQANWVPLYKKYKVSLVLSGHNHDYERITTGGITYIVTGGGGAGLYPCVRSQPGLAKCTSVHQFLEVDSSPAGIAVRSVGTKGETIDQVTIPIRK